MISHQEEESIGVYPQLLCILNQIPNEMLALALNRTQIFIELANVLLVSLLVV